MVFVKNRDKYFAFLEFSIKITMKHYDYNPAIPQVLVYFLIIVLAHSHSVRYSQRTSVALGNLCSQSLL